MNEPRGLWSAAPPSADTSGVTTATIDDLDRFLAARLRVVTVGDGPLPDHPDLSHSLSLREPDPTHELDEWRQLLADLEPDLVLMASEVRVEDLGAEHLTQARVLMRSGGSVVRYQWVLLGSQISLVVAGHHGLDHADLHRLGSLVRGLLDAD